MTVMTNTPVRNPHQYLGRSEPVIRRCAQYVTKQARRVPCNRPCMTFYCGRHDGKDACLPVLMK